MLAAQLQSLVTNSRIKCLKFPMFALVAMHSGICGMAVLSVAIGPMMGRDLKLLRVRSEDGAYDWSLIILVLCVYCVAFQVQGKRHKVLLQP